MKLILKTMFALSTLAVVSVPVSPANAQNSPVVMQITGGSTGKFVATSHSLTTGGYREARVQVLRRRSGNGSPSIPWESPFRS